MRMKITLDTLAKLSANRIIADCELRGFCARKLTSGSITFGYRYRADGGKERWHSLGILGDEITLDEARKAARIASGKVASGIDPATERAATNAAIAADIETTVDKLAEIYLAQFAKKARPKTLYITTRIFNRHILPAFAATQIGAIKRSDIVRVLDAIDGDVMANRVLAVFSSFFNWHARRADDFASPLVRGMARGREEPRDRVLDDEEIAELWAVLADEVIVPRHFADHLRLILLTGQRPGEVGGIEAHEIGRDRDGALWRMPATKNKINKKQLVPLSSAAFAIIEPYLARRGLIFAEYPALTDSWPMNHLRTAINERRKHKGREFMPNWTRHDLRRTARTLMGRNKEIREHIAERVLGHLVGSKVSRTYNHNDYLDEKRDALERLAAMVAQITGANVVPLKTVA